MRPAPVLLMAFAAQAAHAGTAAEAAADVAEDAEAREWRTVVVHHSATEAGSVAAIHAAHKARRDSAGRPWRGIGYHFVIGNGRGMADGAVEATFRWRGQTSGAHAGSRRHNDHGVGICLIGNFEDGPPTDRQIAALEALIAVLRSDYGPAAMPVLPHRAVRATACPGRHFPARLLTARGDAAAENPALVTARKESP